MSTNGIRVTTVMRKLSGLIYNIAKLVEKRREAGDNSQKVREAEEEIREAGDVYPQPRTQGLYPPVPSR